MEWHTPKYVITSMKKSLTDEDSISIFDSKVSNIRDEHEKTQKSTFTKWINFHLENHSSASRVGDLFEDLRDGVLLCKLIEVLTGEALSVNMSRTPKRVHFISNLTTALSVLKRRGLDLINNNPTDLADGNPRIVLGLIWQIILHFQIESNLRQLHDLQGEMVPSTSKQTTSIRRNFREGLSPQVGRSSSTLETTPKKSPSFLSRSSKTPIDKVMLKWVQSQIGPEYGISVTDFDKSWRTGLPFLVLIHKVRKDLVDIEKAKKQLPKDNIQLAFYLAEKHLNIKPLLDVDDVLCEKPDKRSIITYVSQFMANYEEKERENNFNKSKGESYLKKPSKRLIVKIIETKEYHEIITWIEKIIKEIEHEKVTDNKKKAEIDIYKEYNKYHDLRKVFLENRETYELIKKHRKQLSSEDWSKIEGNWKYISENIHEKSIVFEKELPEPLSSIHYWLGGAENLVNLRLDTENLSGSEGLKKINTTIEKLKLHFSNYGTHCQRFGIVYETGKAEKKTVNREFLNKMKNRLDNVKNDYDETMEGLLLLQAHYMILKYIEELNGKMDLWRAGDSLNLVKRWLKEYRNESATMPERIIDNLLEEYRHRIPKTKKGEREKAFAFLTDAQDGSKELIERFISMRELLELLYKYWSEFEDEVIVFDKHLERLENLKALALDDEASESLDKIEKLGQNISEQSVASGRAAIGRRLEEIHKRIKFISKKPQSIGGRLVVDLTIEPSIKSSISEKSYISQSTTSMKIPNLPNLKFSSDINMAKVKDSSLYRYIQKTRLLLTQRCDNSADLESLLMDLKKCEQEIIVYERMKNQSLENLQKSDKKELNVVFSSLKSKLPCKIERIEEILPKVKSIESYFDQLIDWCHNHDLSSTMGKLSINERAGILLSIENMLCILEKPEYVEIFDTRNLRKHFLGIKNKFKLVETHFIEIHIEIVETQILTFTRLRSKQKQNTEREAIQQVINDIEKAKEHGFISEDSIPEEKLYIIKEQWRKTTLDDSTQSEGRINDLIKRKNLIINRNERSVQEIKGSMVEIDMINEAIQLHLDGKNNSQVEEIEKEWLKKKYHLSNLLKIISSLNDIENKLTVEEKPIILDQLFNQLDLIKNEIKLSELNKCPIEEETKNRICILYNLLQEKHRLAYETNYEELMDRLDKLLYTVEDDLPVASVVIKAIAQEAAEFYRHEPKDSISHSRKEILLKKVTTTEEVLRRKMEFFTRLQHLYDGISYIRQQNINWNNIKLSEVDDVEHEIDIALSKIHNEYEGDVEFLSKEIENIQGNFFQLECDRVKEKFRLLVSQLCLICELMKNRKAFLTKFHELSRFANTCQNNINKMITYQVEENVSEERKKSPILLDTKELNDMFTALEIQVDDVITAQHLAQMIIEDYTPENLIGKLRITAGYEGGVSDDAKLLKTNALITKIKLILGNDINNEGSKVNDITWLETYKFIQYHIRNGLEEHGLISQLESQLKEPDSSKENEKTLNIFKNQLEVRQKLRNDLIDDAIMRFISQAGKEFKRIDDEIDMNIADDDYERIKKLEEGDWREWKILVSDIEKLLDNSMCKTVKDKYRNNFVDLEKNAFTLDAKLSKYKKEKEESLSKQNKLIKRLPAFGRWLELAEEDIDSINSMSDSMSPVEKAKNLTQMKDKFVYHMPLVKKLEKIQLYDPDQRKLAEKYCLKFRQLLDKMNSIDIPDAHYIPIKIEFEKVLTPDSTLSEKDFHDIQHLRYTGKEEIPSTSYNDIETELTSVEHELSSLEYMKPTTNTGVTHYLRDGIENEIENITNTLLSIYNGIDVIRTYYALPSLKSLPEAIIDYENLVNYLMKMKEIAIDLEKIKSHPGIIPLLETLHEQIRATNNTSEALKREIEDEQELQVYSNEIMNDLRGFEEKIKIAKEDPNQIFDSYEVDQTLNKLGNQISELKKRYNQPRFFVISSLHGSGTTSPTRRKKFVMKITQTVTTIIKVIEQGQKDLTAIDNSMPYIITDEELQMLRNQLKELEDMLQQGEVMAKKSTSDHSSNEQSRLPSEEISPQPKTVKTYETVITETVTNIEPDIEMLQNKIPFEELDDGTIIEIVTTEIVEEPSISESPEIEIIDNEIQKVTSPQYEIITKEEIKVDDIDEETIKELEDINNLNNEYDKLDKVMDNPDNNIKKQDKNLTQEHQAIVEARKVVCDNAKAYEAAIRAEKERLLANENNDNKISSPQSQFDKPLEVGISDLLIEKSIDEETKSEKPSELATEYDNLTKAIENLEKTISDDDKVYQNVIEKTADAIKEFDRLSNVISDIEKKTKEDEKKRKRDIKDTKLAQKIVLDNGINELAHRESLRESIAQKQEDDTLKARQKLKEEFAEAEKVAAENMKIKEIENTIKNLITSTIDERTIDNIENNLIKLPPDSIIYQDLKKRTDEVKDKYNEVNKIKSTLDEVGISIKNIEKEEEEEENIPLIEQISSTKDKLKKLNDQIKPKIDSLIFIEIPEVKDDIEKTRKELDEVINNLKDNLKNKEENINNLNDANNYANEIATLIENIYDSENILNPKYNSDYLNKFLKNIEEKLSKLKDISLEKLPECDKEFIKKVIENNEKKISNIKNKIQDLEEKCEKISNLENAKSKLLNTIDKESVRADELIKRYNEAQQPFETSESDLQKIKQILNNLNNIIIESKELIKNHDEQQLSSADIINYVDKNNVVINDLKQLKEKIESDLEKEGNLIKEKEKLNNSLKNIIIKANEVLEKDSKPDDLDLVQKDISNLQKQLDNAMDISEIPLEVLQHSPSSDVWDLKNRLDEIAFALAHQKEDAKKKMKLQKIASDISDNVKEIQNKINEAENIESNPNSSIDDLRKTSTNLKNIKFDLLPKLDEEFKKIPTTPEVDGLRNKILQEQSKLVEDLNNAESAIEERINSIDELDDLVAETDMKLDSIIKKIDETPIYDIDEILKIEYEDIIPLNDIKEKINESVDRANKKHSPEVVDIYNKLNDVLQKAVDKKKKIEKTIDDQQKAAKELAEAERKAAEELAEAERKNLESQKQIQDEIEKLVVAPINEENINIINEKLSQLSEDSPVYSDLKNKAEEVKEKVEKVKNIMNTIKNIDTNLETIIELPEEEIPLIDKVNSLESKIDKLENEIKPNILAITFSGVSEIDDNIKNKQKEIDDYIQLLTNMLENYKIKQKSLEDLDKYLHCVSEIDKSTDLPLDMKNSEKTRNYLAELYQKLQDVLDNLKTMPTDHLDEISNKKLEDGIKVVENNIEKILNDMSDLDKFDEEVKLLKEKTDSFISSLDNNTESIDKILNRYKDTPQEYEVAIEDVEIVKPLFAKISTMIENNNDIIRKLDENGITTDILLEKSNNLKNKLIDLQALEKKISNDLIREKELISRKNDLEPKVYSLANEIKQTLENDFTPEFLTSLEKEISLLQNNINCAIDDSEIPLNVVIHSPASDIWYLKDILDDGALSLVDAKKMLNDKLELQEACDKIEKLTNEANEIVKNVINVTYDPTSNSNNLYNALEDIKHIFDNILPNIENNIEKLSKSHELEDLKNKAFIEKEKLNNEINNTKNKIEDRLGSMKEFDNLAVLLNDKINNPETKFDDIDDLKITYDSLCNAAEHGLLNEDNKMKEISNKFNNLINKLLLEREEKLKLQEKEKLMNEEKQNEINKNKKVKDDLIEKLKNENEIIDNSLLSPHTTPSTLTAFLENHQNILSTLNSLPKIIFDEKDNKEINNGNENVKCLKIKLDKYNEFNSSKNNSFEKLENIRLMFENLPQISNLKQNVPDIMRTIEILEENLDQLETSKDNLFLLSSELYPYEIPSSEARIFEEDIITMKEIVKDYKNKILNEIDQTKNEEKLLETVPLQKKDIIFDNEGLIKPLESEKDKVIINASLLPPKEEIEKDTESLKKEQENIKKLIENKEKLLDKIPLKLLDGEEILKKYQESPQPYDIAIKDLQNIDIIIPNLIGVVEESKNIIESLNDNEIPFVDVNNSTNNINETINHLKQLKGKIESDLEKEDKLIKEKEKLNNNLKDIIIRANEVLEKDSKPDDLDPIQEDISHLQTKFDIAIDNSEIPLEVIQHSPSSDVWDLKDRLDAIAFTLAHQKEDAKKKMELQKIVSDIYDKLKKIHDQVKKAENVESDPNSTMEELNDAAGSLKDISWHLLPKLEEELDKLPITSDIDELRNKTLEEQMKLIEDLNITDSAIQERIDNISELYDLIDSVNIKIDNIVKAMDETPVHDEESVYEIERDQILPLYLVVPELNELAKTSKKINDPKLVDLLKKLEDLKYKIANKIRDAQSFKEAQSYISNELAEAERKVADDLLELVRKAEKQMPAAEEQIYIKDNLEKHITESSNEENANEFEKLNFKISEIVKQIKDEILKARKIKDDPNSCILNLTKVMVDLENIFTTILPMLNEKVLEFPQTSELNYLRQQVLEEQTKLSNDLEEVKSAINDRIDAIDKLDRKIDDGNIYLDNLNEQLKSWSINDFDEVSKMKDIELSCLNKMAEDIILLSDNANKHNDHNKVKFLEKLDKTAENIVKKFNEVESIRKEKEKIVEEPTPIDIITKTTIDYSQAAEFDDDSELVSSYRYKDDNEITTDFNVIDTDSKPTKKVSKTDDNVSNISATKSLEIKSDPENVKKAKEMQSELEKTSDIISSLLNTIPKIKEKPKKVKKSKKEDEIVTVDVLNNKRKSLWDYINELKEKLKLLKNQVQPTLNKMANENIDDQNMANEIQNNLCDANKLIKSIEEELHKKEKEEKDVEKLINITPIITDLTKNINQSLMDSGKQNYIPSKVDDHKDLLDDLESKREKLEKLIKDIPEDIEESEELREKSIWDLSKLIELIETLKKAFNLKMLALSLFNKANASYKNKIDNINKNINKLRKVSDSNDIYVIREVLDTSQNEYLKLKNLMDEMNEIDKSTLPDDKLEEFNDLLLNIELLMEEINSDRSKLLTKLSKLESAEKLKEELRNLDNELKELIKISQIILIDAAVSPSQYKELPEKIDLTIHKIRDFLQTLPKDKFVKEVEKDISEANRLVIKLLEKWKLWLQYVEQKDIITDTLDELRYDFDNINRQKNILFDEAVKNYETGKNIIFKLGPLKENLVKAIDLSVDLQPLDLPSSESNYLKVDLGSLESNCINYMTELEEEINDELEISKILDQLLKELSQVDTNIEDAVSGKNIYELRRMNDQVDDMKPQLDEVKYNINDRSNTKKYIGSKNPDKFEHLLKEFKKINERLKALLSIEEDIMGGAENAIDIDAAANVLATIYADRHPRDVLLEYKIDAPDFDTDSLSDASGYDDSKSGRHTENLEAAVEALSYDFDSQTLAASPNEEIIDTNQQQALQVLRLARQRRRWQRVLRAALPLQAMLVLLLGAACLVPHCDDEYCCQLLNNFINSFDLALDNVNGPPPF